MYRPMERQTDWPLAIRWCNTVRCTKNSKVCVYIPGNTVRSNDDNIMF